MRDISTESQKMMHQEKVYTLVVISDRASVLLTQILSKISMYREFDQTLV